MIKNSKNIHGVGGQASLFQMREEPISTDLNVSNKAGEEEKRLPGSTTGRPHTSAREVSAQSTIWLDIDLEKVKQRIRKISDSLEQAKQELERESSSDVDN